jgi:serine/threonine-protein kinase RsbW
VGQVDVQLSLPRQPWTVPAVRHLAGAALSCARAAAECREAVELAITESCSNAVRHADPADCYQVRLRVTEEVCQVEVADAGAGFDPDRLAAGAPSYAMSGRGLALIRDVVDQVQVQARQPAGTSVRFTKRLY